jgi:hypothetical protein
VEIDRAKWDRALARLGGLPARLNREIEQAGADVAQRLPEEVRAGMQSQAPGGQQFTPLHWFTVQEKGTDVALAGGDLEEAITAHARAKGLTVAVGIPAGAISGGTSLSLIGWVQEFGIQIAVTDAMRAYLHTRGFELSPSTEHVVIPARPWLRPVLRVSKPWIRARYAQAVAAALRG